MKNKGITLVALVITIIILLILAGISISAITNQGIFAQAQNAKNLTEEKTAEENEILTNYLEQINAILGGQVTESVSDGAVVTPINDITTWLKTGGISKQYSYTTIEQVIADSNCIEILMNNENAMKYLARSTEFADAICESETGMTYLGDSVYVDDTVLNSDIWVSSISSSNYYELVYDPITVHSSASATISFNGKSFTSDASGNTTKIIPWGTFTFSDSVSGQSYERTIDKNTIDLYVMPEGALYWYGNNIASLSYSSSVRRPYASIINVSPAFGTNSFSVNYVAAGSCSISTKYQVALDNYSSVNLLIKNANNIYYQPYILIQKGNEQGNDMQCKLATVTLPTVITKDINDYTGEYYIAVGTNSGGENINFEISALWLE